MRSDRKKEKNAEKMQKKIANFAFIFGRKCIDYEGNTLDCAEISTINKSNNKAFPM